MTAVPKALHLLGSAADGGAEVYFRDLTLALHAAGLPTAAAIRAHPAREAALGAAGVPTRVCRFGGPLDLFTRGEVAAFAREQGAGALVAWMNRAAAHAPKGPWARIGRLGGYYDLKYYKGFDALVANTDDIGRWIVGQGWPADRVSVIPNFAEAAPGAPVDRAAYQTPESAPLLLAVGRLHTVKAHDVTLKALARMPDAFLWIAGEGPLRGELEALARDLNVASRVRFLGWVENPSPLYRAADLCLFPSRFEPLGNVVIQAWAHGLPVVAAASAGPAALIRDGVDGRLVPIDDPEALASAARGLLADADLRDRCVAAGLTRVAETFSKSAVVARWRDLFVRTGGAACAA